MIHLTEEPQKPSRIPEFTSREEEAAFWDTHQFTEFWDDLEPGRLDVSPQFRDRVLARVAAQRPVNGGRPKPLSVDLDLDDRAAIEQRARERGLHPTTLVQSWIEERLERDERRYAGLPHSG